MSDFLRSMAEASFSRLERARRMLPFPEMRLRAEKVGTTPLQDSEFHLFAEIKPISPAEGSFGAFDPATTAQRYCSGGATALSVLTEPTRFGGSLGLMQSVAGAVTAPVIRKDFLVDPYQVWEAKAFGADGVLLIARLFDRDSLASMITAVGDAGLFVLVEVFDESDLALIDVSWESDPNLLIGVNSRDLKTLQVRHDTHQRLLGMLPSGNIRIAESGIASVDRVVELRDMGYDGVLVGTSLMRSDDPADLIKRMMAGIAS